MMVILGYYLILDMTEESGEGRYAVMRQCIEGDGGLVTQIEREGCTLEQARARLAQLYKENPPEGVTQI